MKKPLIVCAPQAAGKTRNAKLIMSAFGCVRLVDEWDGRQILAAGDLALTNLSITPEMFPQYSVLSLQTALSRIQAA